MNTSDVFEKNKRWKVNTTEAGQTGKECDDCKN